MRFERSKRRSACNAPAGVLTCVLSPKEGDSLAIASLVQDLLAEPEKVFFGLSFFRPAAMVVCAAFSQTMAVTAGRWLRPI